MSVGEFGILLERFSISHISSVKISFPESHKHRNIKQNTQPYHKTYPCSPPTRKFHTPTPMIEPQTVTSTVGMMTPSTYCNKPKKFKLLTPFSQEQEGRIPMHGWKECHVNTIAVPPPFGFQKGGYLLVNLLHWFWEGVFFGYGDFTDLERGS